MLPGVRLDKNKELIPPELSIDQCRHLIADGTITGGMIPPKIETCIYALEQGVQGVVISRRQGAACGIA